MTFSAASYFILWLCYCAASMTFLPLNPIAFLPWVPCSKTHAFCLCHCFILEHFITFPFHWAILLLFPSSEGSYWPFSITLSHCSTNCSIIPHHHPFPYPMPLPSPTPYPITLLYRCAAPYAPLLFHCPMTISPVWHLSEKKQIRAWTQEFVLT